MNSSSDSGKHLYNVSTTSQVALEVKMAHELLERPVGVIVMEAGTFLLVAVIAFLGNALICLAMYRNRSLRRVTNIFVLSLAISDMCMACFCMPVSIGILMRGKWVYSQSSVCEFQAFFIYVLAGVSLYTMAVTAANRYYKVVKPRRYPQLFTMKLTVAIIVTVWVLIGSLIGVLMGIKWLRVKYESAKASCVMFADLGTKPLTYAYQVFAFLVFFIIPSTFITRCYRQVFKAVRRHEENIAKTLKNRSFVGSADEVKMTKTLFLVVLAFASCWSPVIAYEMILISSNMFGFLDRLPRQIHLVWLYFGTLSSAVNAFIYGAMNRAFRREFIAIFTCNKRTQITPFSGTVTTLTNMVR
ncbi:predicted protein [Nematostella vectensis]|uniref:G-protein coupled receptors family 1 profile domain-containing protein n=1 Tax=Nematostella vectensis TaxID=45351 RepID=A7SFM3_NEMVE|nr:predicted protein [Nematostella vectensis]|eukprot:XP_001629585.1 predicted protein [Nematostella vectensis]